MNHRDGKPFWIGIGILFAVLLIGMYFWDERQEAQREDNNAHLIQKQERELRAYAGQVAETRIRAEIGICERLKADRIDVARALTAEALFLEQLVLHPPPHLTVGQKRAAVHAFKQTHESANQKRLRLWQCDPLIRHDEKVRDRDALREARGEL